MRPRSCARAAGLRWSLAGWRRRSSGWAGAVSRCRHTSCITVPHERSRRCWARHAPQQRARRCRSPPHSPRRRACGWRRARWAPAVCVRSRQRSLSTRLRAARRTHSSMPHAASSGRSRRRLAPRGVSERQNARRAAASETRAPARHGHRRAQWSRRQWKRRQWAKAAARGALCAARYACVWRGRQPRHPHISSVRCASRTAEGHGRRPDGRPDVTPRVLRPLRGCLVCLVYFSLPRLHEPPAFAGPTDPRARLRRCGDACAPPKRRALAHAARVAGGARAPRRKCPGRGPKAPRWVGRVHAGSGSGGTGACRRCRRRVLCVRVLGLAGSAGALQEPTCAPSSEEQSRRRAHVRLTCGSRAAHSP